MGAADEAAEVEALANRFVSDQWASGIVIGLVRGGRADIRGFGKATGDGTEPDAHTLFEIGSVTKLFTSLTLAAMVAEGEMALDDPVSNFLPAEARVPEFDGQPITLRSLATHSSGLPPFRAFDTEWDPGWLYSVLSTCALERRPGSQYEYSNLGMALLGHALSLRAKQPYGDLVKERVLDPLGLGHTFVGAIPAGERLAEGHDGAGAPAPPIELDVLAPAGGIRSDAADMAAFVQANLRPPRRLRAPIVSTQAEHGLRPGGKVGLGWHIGLGEAPGVRWHDGETAGFHSFIALDGEKLLGVVVLANTSTEAVDVLGHTLLQMLRGEPHDLGLPPRVAVPLESLDRCTGRFVLEPGFELTITRTGGQLFGQFTGEPKLRIYPASETTFHFIANVRLDFEMGAGGRARRVVIHTREETVSAGRAD